MTKEKKILEELKKHDEWMKMASDCEHAYQQYIGIPTPLPTCRLIDDACRFENCPKVDKTK